MPTTSSDYSQLTTAIGNLISSNNSAMATAMTTAFGSSLTSSINSAMSKLIVDGKYLSTKDAQLSKIFDANWKTRDIQRTNNVNSILSVLKEIRSNVINPSTKTPTAAPTILTSIDGTLKSIKINLDSIINKITSQPLINNNNSNNLGSPSHNRKVTPTDYQSKVLEYLSDFKRILEGVYNARRQNTPGDIGALGTALGASLGAALGGGPIGGSLGGVLGNAGARIVGRLTDSLEDFLVERINNFFSSASLSKLLIDGLLLPFQPIIQPIKLMWSGVKKVWGTVKDALGTAVQALTKLKGGFLSLAGFIWDWLKKLTPLGPMLDILPNYMSALMDYSSMLGQLPIRALTEAKTMAINEMESAINGAGQIMADYGVSFEKAIEMQLKAAKDLEPLPFIYRKVYDKMSDLITEAQSLLTSTTFSIRQVDELTPILDHFKKETLVGIDITNSQLLKQGSLLYDNLGDIARGYLSTFEKIRNTMNVDVSALHNFVEQNLIDYYQLTSETGAELLEKTTSQIKHLAKLNTTILGTNDLLNKMVSMRNKSASEFFQSDFGRMVAINTRNPWQIKRMIDTGDVAGALESMAPQLTSRVRAAGLTTTNYNTELGLAKLRSLGIDPDLALRLLNGNRDFKGYVESKEQESFTPFQKYQQKAQEQYLIEWRKQNKVFTDTQLKLSKALRGEDIESLVKKTAEHYANSGVLGFDKETAKKALIADEVVGSLMPNMASTLSAFMSNSLMLANDIFQVLVKFTSISVSFIDGLTKHGFEMFTPGSSGAIEFATKNAQTYGEMQVFVQHAIGHVNKMLSGIPGIIGGTISDLENTDNNLKHLAKKYDLTIQPYTKTTLASISKAANEMRNPEYSKIAKDSKGNVISADAIASEFRTRLSTKSEGLGFWGELKKAIKEGLDESRLGNLLNIWPFNRGAENAKKDTQSLGEQIFSELKRYDFKYYQQYDSFESYQKFRGITDDALLEELTETLRKYKSGYYPQDMRSNLRGLSTSEQIAESVKIQQKESAEKTTEALVKSSESNTSNLIDNTNKQTELINSVSEVNTSKIAKNQESASELYLNTNKEFQTRLSDEFKSTRKLIVPIHYYLKQMNDLLSSIDEATEPAMAHYYNFNKGNIPSMLDSYLTEMLGFIKEEKLAMEDEKKLQEEYKKANSGNLAGGDGDYKGFSGGADVFNPNLISGEFMEQRATHLHNGIDYAIPRGTPLPATENATVFATNSEYTQGHGYGAYVILRGDESGKFIGYAHCDKVASQVGQKVKPGDIIAYSGGSGNAGRFTFGDHLHFMICDNDTFNSGDPGSFTNPKNYLAGKDIKINPKSARASASKIISRSGTRRGLFSIPILNRLFGRTLSKTGIAGTESVGYDEDILRLVAESESGGNISIREVNPIGGNIGFGKFQLTYPSGGYLGYLNWLGKDSRYSAIYNKLINADPRNSSISAVSQAWSDLASTHPQLFEESQNKYILLAYYDPISSLVSSYGKKFQSAALSFSVLGGSGGATRLLKKSGALNTTDERDALIRLYTTAMSDWQYGGSIHRNRLYNEAEKLGILSALSRSGDGWVDGISYNLTAPVTTPSGLADIGTMTLGSVLPGINPYLTGTILTGSWRAEDTTNPFASGISGEAYQNQLISDYKSVWNDNTYTPTVTSPNFQSISSADFANINRDGDGLSWGYVPDPYNVDKHPEWGYTATDPSKFGLTSLSAIDVSGIPLLKNMPDTASEVGNDMWMFNTARKGSLVKQGNTLVYSYKSDKTSSSDSVATPATRSSATPGVKSTTQAQPTPPKTKPTKPAPKSGSAGVDIKALNSNVKTLISTMDKNTESNKNVAKASKELAEVENRKIQQTQQENMRIRHDATIVGAFFDYISNPFDRILGG